MALLVNEIAEVTGLVPVPQIVGVMGLIPAFVKRLTFEGLDEPRRKREVAEENLATFADDAPLA